MLSSLPLAVPAPSTPLGPFADSFTSWTTWATLMGFTGTAVLAVAAAGPVARRAGGHVLAGVTSRLARIAVLLGLLAIPSILTDVAHGASESGGYDYGAAWDAVFDGSNDGRLLGIELVLIALGAALLVPLTARRVASSRARTALLGTAVTAGLVSLGTTKFPDKAPADVGRTTFETIMWMLHLFGGAVWSGGLIGLVAIVVPGALEEADRRVFWSPAIRRFSVLALASVGAIALSGLWLYWEHVDGPTQLFTTMYGRVLGVKILLFGSLLLLGTANQFWLHPKIEALRAAGDERPLRTVLAREFGPAVGLEVVLVLTVLFVAPFLHGSARNQAYQGAAAETAAPGTTKLPKIATKQVSTSTWVYGTLETIGVVSVLGGAYAASGRIARRRTTVGAPASNDRVGEPAAT